LIYDLFAAVAVIHSTSRVCQLTSALLMFSANMTIATQVIIFTDERIQSISKKKAPHTNPVNLLTLVF
jgi:hypothetical protein